MKEPLADTLKRTVEPESDAEENQALAPGLVLIYSGGRPCAEALPLCGGELEIGREHPSLLGKDPRISRRHARVTHDGHSFSVADLGSSNGTVVDGVALAAHRAQVVRGFLRVGDSVLIPVPDIGLFAARGVRVEEGRVLGPAMQGVTAAAQRLAESGELLHIAGESGVGKEGVARAFHASGAGRTGRFIAVNCAAIPESIAERLLFGAKKGTYSGADADADGYIQAADGGTLFLDEIAELHQAVQAKLLRVLEEKEFLPLGATRLRAVSLQVCSATHQDLRAQVEAGRLREDLYFRIAQPQVLVPPLRERLEEIPWLIQLAAQRTAPTLPVHTSLIEACLARPWPGNVRELLTAIRNAANLALSESASRIDTHHLNERAGLPWSSTSKEPPPPPPVRDDTTHRAAIVEALRQAGGNITAAARLLNVHRTQLHRWLSRYGITAGRTTKED